MIAIELCLPLLYVESDMQWEIAVDPWFTFLYVDTDPVRLIAVERCLHLIYLDTDFQWEW